MAKLHRSILLQRLAAVLVTLLVLGLAAVNFFLARHRTLYVVNGFSQPLLVEIHGGARVRVPPFGQVPIEVREGLNEGTASGPTNLALRFDMPRGLRERWLGERHYVLNPGAAAVLIAESLPFARSAETKAGRGPAIQLYYGEVFAPLPQAKYLFRAFPTGKTSSSGADVPEERRVGVVQVSVPELFFALVGQGQSEQALKLAQWHLRRHPGATELLPAYVGVSMGTSQAESARAFLAENIKRRPVDIQWHRMYQEVEQSIGSSSNLIAQYDGLLQSDPTNSALWYLRGRLAARKSAAMPFYERALTNDPQNAFASYALGYSYASVGDWTNARPYLARARQLQPNDAQMEELFFDARLALGEWAALETELNALRRVDPLLYTVTVQLADVLVAQGKVRELPSLLSGFATALRSRGTPGSAQIMGRLHSRVAYVMGDFQTLAELGRQDPSPDGLLNRFYALVELGKLAEACDLILPDNPLFNDPLQVLVVAAALDKAGIADQASRWLKQAITMMRAARDEYRLAAEMLMAAQPPALAAVLDLSLPPQSKAALLVVLAQKFPAARVEFVSVAQTLNVHREFPYHLIGRLAQP